MILYNIIKESQEKEERYALRLRHSPLSVPCLVCGKTRLDDLVEHPDAYDYISNMIEEADLYGDGAIRTNTELNDYLWFDLYDDLAEAGYMTVDHEWIEDDDEEEENEDA